MGSISYYHELEGGEEWFDAMQVLTRITTDISSILQFDWYELVYYKMEESHFPSMSNEQSGHFVGISEHVGHALTFLILTDNTQKIIH